MKKLLSISLFIFSFSFFTFLSAQTGTWTAVRDTSINPNYGVCLLMTDGTVICHNQHGGKYGTGWDRLTPDIHGSYANGTWDTIASNVNDRLFFSSQVLPNGNVYVAGGEYGAGGTNGEVYSPYTNTWTACDTIPRNWNIYDGNSELLYNGNILEGPQIGAMPSFDCLFYNPASNKYSIAPTALYNHDEASWLKLRDSSVLFVGIGSPFSTRYIPQINKWIYDDTLPGNLYDPYGYEAGPAFMLPDRKAFFTGATGFNAIYAPSGDTNHGTWIAADSFPVIGGNQMGTPDASGAMMVNGHILLSCSPIGTITNEFRAPAYFVEYDYTTNKFTQVTSTIPIYGADSLADIPAYETQMLNLPDGNILVSISQTSHSKQYYIYTPGSASIAQGKPTIDNIIDLHCNSYKVTGKLFNGISEGSAFGDDWQMATNYPIIRLTDGTNVYYARTSNWNRIGALETDSLEDTAYFTLPSIPGGTYSLVVTSNGFASNPVILTTFGVAITSHTNLSSCNSGSGSATALAADGIAPYTYSWSPSGGTNATASNLSGGTYTITVTDNSGCSTSASINITQAAPLSVYTTISDITCLGGKNGRAKAWVSGGTVPYSYLWNPGSGTNALISGLSLGTYTVTVSDSCGNTATASATIKQPDTLSVSIDSIDNISCYGGNNGYVNATVHGGTSPFTYFWSNGATTGVISGLSSASYTLTVSDYCGDTAIAVATLTQPGPIIITTTIFNKTSDSVCNGEAIVGVIGGTRPYTYRWVPGGETTDTLRNRCAGRYCCKVTDNNGCTETACVFIISGSQNINPETNSVTVYPNPNTGQFTISLSRAELVSASHPIVEIYNVLGEKVYSQLVTINSQLSINLRSKPNGIYFYRVLKDDGSLLGDGKIIVQR